MNTGATLTTPKSFAAVVMANALKDPAKPIYHMLADDGSEAGMLTFGELHRRAAAMSTWLRRRNATGERALLLFPAGLNYVTAFHGCLYGGVIAVPAYPPKNNRNLSRLLSIVRDCDPRFVLTDASTLAMIRAGIDLYPELQSCEWIATDNFSFDQDNADEAALELTPDQVAFLQYTSGSTSDPKGVMVTHGNLLRNEALMRDAFQVTSKTVIVSWLPMYHDMGLIGNILAAGYNGVSCYLMSPVAFLRRPITWLEAISRYKATASGGPNFAFDLCVDRIRPEHCSGLDLSRWTVAFNGSEPIRANTLDRFTAKFRPFGFRSGAFMPCYGLAETTLFVSGSQMGEPPVVERLEKAALQTNRAIPSHSTNASDAYVSSGIPRVEHVTIVDPASGLECPDGLVGEIWVSDPSVAKGYWRKPALSVETFGATLPGNSRQYLRTGDLGTRLGCSQVIVLGRLKDLIIIRGRNHYPQDIEITAEAADSCLRAGCTVAFSVEQNGEEKLVIVAEAVRERRFQLDMDEIGQLVSAAIANEHEIRLAELVLVQPATILKTSSGKLQRRASKQAYMCGELEVIGRWAEGDDSISVSRQQSDSKDVAEWLRAALSTRLRIPPAHLDPCRSIADYGLDSLGAVELLANIEEQFGIQIEFESLFLGEPNLNTLAALMRAEQMRTGVLITPAALPTAASEPAYIT